MIGAPATAILVVFVIGFLMPLKILVAVIQTFIFCKLAMVYIAAAVEDTEHH
jgi:F0F1-type ATP synthase membrane subunit a